MSSRILRPQGSACQRVPLSSLVRSDLSRTASFNQRLKERPSVGFTISKLNMIANPRRVCLESFTTATATRLACHVSSSRHTQQRRNSIPSHHTFSSSKSPSSWFGRPPSTLEKMGITAENAPRRKTTPGRNHPGSMGLTEPSPLLTLLPSPNYIARHVGAWHSLQVGSDTKTFGSCMCTDSRPTLPCPSNPTLDQSDHLIPPFTNQTITWRAPYDTPAMLPLNPCMAASHLKKYASTPGSRPATSSTCRRSVERRWSSRDCRAVNAPSTDRPPPWKLRRAQGVPKRLLDNLSLSCRVTMTVIVGDHHHLDRRNRQNQPQQQLTCTKKGLNLRKSRISCLLRQLFLVRRADTVSGIHVSVGTPVGTPFDKPFG